jgi:hypothetical protein
MVSVLAANRLCSGQVRIVNYNIAQLQGDEAALMAVFAWSMGDDRPGFVLAPHIFALQEVRSIDAPALLELINAAAPRGVSYALATYTSSQSEDGSGGAQALYYRGDVLTEVAEAHADVYTGAGRFADRWKLSLNAYSDPDASFYLYSMHLRANEGEPYESERLMGVQNVMANALGLPAGSHIIYAGDMNFYNHQEPGYIEFVVEGPGAVQAIDPLGSGTWGGGSNAIKHTQSPRLINANELAGGGMDDRFDFQFSTAAFHDGNGLALMEGTYRSFGNDGMHYNVAINDGNNMYWPDDLSSSNALADDLHEASDHVPVIAEYQIPARMAATIPADFGWVIEGAAMSIDAEVANPADVVTALGAEDLDFVATGSGVLEGSVAGTVPPLAPPLTWSLPIDTSNPGEVSGSVTFLATSEAAEPPLLIASTAGTILRHARPSFSAMGQLDSITMEFDVKANSGTQYLDVPIHNFGFDDFQSLLDVDAMLGIDRPLEQSGALPSGIGASAEQITLSIDTTDLGPGSFEQLLNVATSDEDLPGEAEASLELILLVNVAANPLVGDIAPPGGDGVVGPLDLAAMLASWGSCAGCPADLAPPGGDDEVGPADLARLLANWG